MALITTIKEKEKSEVNLNYFEVPLWASRKREKKRNMYAFTLGLEISVIVFRRLRLRSEQNTNNQMYQVAWAKSKGSKCLINVLM